jgi:hypothetical protein
VTGQPTDRRRMRRHHERELVVLALLVLVGGGGGLIALVFGLEALLGALPCLLAGGGAIGVLYALFVLAERWVNR